MHIHICATYEITSISHVTMTLYTYFTHYISHDWYISPNRYNYHSCKKNIDHTVVMQHGKTDPILLYVYAKKQPTVLSTSHYLHVSETNMHPTKLYIHVIYLTWVYGMCIHIMPHEITGMDCVTCSSIYVKCISEKIWLHYCKYRSYSHHAKSAYWPNIFV